MCLCKSHVFREISSQYEKRSTKALTGMLTGDVGQVTNPPLQGVTHSPAPKETSHCRRLGSPGTSVTITVPSVTLLPFCPVSSTNVSEVVCLPWKGLSSHTHPLSRGHPGSTVDGLGVDSLNQGQGIKRGGKSRDGDCLSDSSENGAPFFRVAFCLQTNVMLSLLSRRIPFKRSFYLLQHTRK